MDDCRHISVKNVRMSADFCNNLYREAGMNRSGNTGIARLLNIVGEAFFYELPDHNVLLSKMPA